MLNNKLIHKSADIISSFLSLTSAQTSDLTSKWSGSGCITVVERMPNNQEMVGSNPT